MVLELLALQAIRPYKISYYDCSEAQEVRRYDRDKVCEQVKPRLQTRQEYQIVQSPRIMHSRGYSCDLQVSAFMFKCGAWSHLKFGAVPEINHIVKVSTEWCHRMATQRVFIPPEGGSSYPLKFEELNIIPLVVYGALEEKNDKIICTGEDRHIGNTLHTNVVYLEEYRILIREETYAFSGDEVEVQTAGVRLPCNKEERGCETGTATFIWGSPKQRCPLQLVRRFKPAKVMGTYLLDVDSRILLNTTGVTRITNCPMELVKTNYKGLYLIDQGTTLALPDLDPGELELSIEFKIVSDYANYRMELKLSDIREGLNAEACLRHSEGNQEELYQVENELFSLVKGDLYYTVRCKLKEAEIREANTCFLDIPIRTTPPGFVRAEDRLFVPSSPIVPCSKRYGLAIKAREGWVEINPHVKPTMAPQEGDPRLPSSVDHIDVSQGGLYTAEEIQSWERLISYPAYHSALLKEIGWGICLGEGKCEADGPTQGINYYSLGNLVKEEEEKLGWLTDIKAWIRQKGDYLALVVILWVVLKIVIDIAMLSFTLLKEGPGAFLALLVSLYLSNQIQFNKIRKRTQRLRREKEEGKGKTTKTPRNRPQSTINSLNLS